MFSPRARAHTPHATAPTMATAVQISIDRGFIRDRASVSVMRSLPGGARARACATSHLLAFRGDVAAVRAVVADPSRPVDSRRNLFPVPAWTSAEVPDEVW